MRHSDAPLKTKSTVFKAETFSYLDLILKKALLDSKHSLVSNLDTSYAAGSGLPAKERIFTLQFA